MPRDDEQDERDRLDPPGRPGRSDWMDDEDNRHGGDAKYERRYPNQKKGMPVWGIVAIVIGSILGVGCVGSVLLAVLGWTFTPAAPPAPPPPPVVVPDERKTYTRDEFKALVVGKSGNELVQVLGFPAASDTRGGGGTWTYRNLTRDPATGKLDPTATLRFEDSVVKEVDF